MSNLFLSPGHILSGGDARQIEGAADDIFAAVFNLLDADFGGEISGDIAARAASTARRILTAELEVFDGQAARQRAAAELAAIEAAATQ